MKFKSKLSIGLLFISFIPILSLFFLFAFEVHGWIGMIILLPGLIFLIDIFVNTHYLLTENVLIVRCGFFYKKAIDLGSIQKISKSNSIINAPALSFDRIEIKFNQNDTLIISPQNKNDFIKKITQQNSNILVDLTQNTKQ
ncbi:MAG: PH domain-containing protein [Chitinophagaceae bacterium]|nr:MAG: hypothetical protein UZ11_BCD004000543 [Bacteroidetes bacterium OLB11]MCC6448497.1 PH domain-containing protein [Chitinophagaceae bacterium]HMN33464.1 PH domain-containing protein [Chitinophagaceae bacterium]